jgi:branched-chain amino acid transport system ATP-binding protein
MTGGKPADFIVETRDLTKSFGGFTAVRNVSLKIRRGTIHALIGPNGAGKSTVFNLITRFLEPTSGRITYNGEDITGQAPENVARKGMVRSFQISAVFPGLSVRDNVRIALQQPTGMTYRFWAAESRLHRLHARVDELLEALELQGHGHLMAGELPYGRKRALELATTLALNPEMLLLDEPMAGLGTEDIERISRLIKAVAAKRTVLMVEHNLSVVENLSDVITVLTRGEVLVEGAYSEISNHPDVVEAYLGVAHD